MKVLDIINESASSLEAEFGAPPKGTTTPTTEKWYARNLRHNVIMVQTIKQRWDWKLFKALRVIGWLGPCAWLAASYWALDDIAGLTPEEFTKQTGVPAEKKNQWVADSRSMLLGTFAAQYLAPLVYYSAKYILRFTGVLQIVAGIAGTVLTKGRGGKLMMGAVVLEQAALIGFVNWLGSPAGVTWMQQHVLVGGLLKLTGASLGSIWDLLYRKFFEYTGIQQPAASNVDQAVDNVSNLPKSKNDPTDAELDAWQARKDVGTRVTTDLTPTLPINGR